MAKLSGEQWASHMAKNLASLHAACVKELDREQADRLVRLALDAAERQTYELIMFACRGCGTQCASSHGPGLAVCETCCEDHDYEYRSDLRTKACKHCEKPVDPDWYD